MADVRNVLISIGCDEYEQMGALGGAENDARSLFDLLMNPAFGSYDPHSILRVDSPTFDEMRGAIIEGTSRVESGGVVTFFFAGHGVVKNGVFHMCLRDTNPARFSATAFSLTTLLSIMQEVRPSHTNILIDACNSGGVMGDFQRALTADGFGDSGTMSISLLAACARDQGAMEIGGQGVFTSSIINCISGTVFSQDITSELDLADVARVVSESMRGNANQQPVFWGLNLTGRPNFCRNPHQSEDSPLRKILAEARPLNLPREIRSALREIHTEVEDCWVPGRLQELLMDVVENSEIATGAKLRFLNQILQSFRSRAINSCDPFREIEIVATCLAPMLKFCGTDESTDRLVIRECESLADLVAQTVEVVVCELEEDRYSLLGETGFGEFYLLPIRLLKLLGWTAWSTTVRGAAEGEVGANLLKRALTKILENYAGSIRSISEVQAPFLVSLCSASLDRNVKELVEELLGRLFLDVCETNANIARCDISDEDVIEFLLARVDKKSTGKDLSANPSALVFALACIAAMLDLDEAFDPGFEDLDHVNSNAFIPESYSSFHMLRIEHGFNATVKIGHEAWKTADFRDICKNIKWPTPETRGVELLSGLCSLVFPNRVAWHMLGRGLGSASVRID